MEILVVGGTRFFGIPMLRKLLDEGHDVTVATRGNAVNPFRSRTKQVILDRTDPDSVKAALSGREYDLIIDKIAYSSNDVKHLLDHVRCRRYIQMSSGSVYSEDRMNTPEEDFDPQGYPLVWTDRNDDYAEGKRQAERAPLEYMDISDCVFVRYPVVLGKHDYTNRLRFYIDHVLNEKAMYADDLDMETPFIHETEAGEFMAYIADRKICGAVNGCSSGTITIRQIVSRIEELTKKTAVFDPSGDPAPYNGAKAGASYDTAKARKTGYRFSRLEDWIYDLIRSETEDMMRSAVQ